MEKNFISEEQVKTVLEKILNEQSAKVSRTEYGRVLFKIEELENTLKETSNELRKLQNIIPRGLKTTTDKKLSSISSYTIASQNVLNQLKDKIRQHKRSSIPSQEVDERKK